MLSSCPMLRLSQWMLLLALALGYLIFHPAWYGDAVWYALDLQHAGVQPLPVDPGHLLWRPLGAGVYSLGSRIVPHLDPLVAFQWLSALGAAGGVFAVFVLMRRLERPFDEALGAAALFGVSHMAVAYGGSGSSYPLASALGIAAVIPLVQQNREWRWAEGVRGALLMLCSWSVWGVGVLLLPLLGAAAALRSDGAVLRRLLRGASLAALAGALILGVALVAYIADTPDPALEGFPHWYSASGHGITPHLSAMGVARAALGLVIAFVYVGTLGTSFKGLLLRDAEIATFGEMIVPLLTFAIFVLMLGVAAVGILRACRRRDRNVGEIALLVLAVLLPVGGFASLWQGSDVERFSLALPLLCMGVIIGFREMTARFAWLPVLVAAVSTIVLYAVPSVVSGGGLVHGLGREARQHLPEGSLLVLTGQRLGASVWTPMTYFSKLAVHSVSYDVSVHGAEGWDERLRASVQRALASGKRIAVLSDLLGEPTPGGIRHSLREYPVPSYVDTANLFARWRQGDRWSAGGCTFVEILDRP